MNNKKAKEIKQLVYGDYSPKFRKYFRHRKTGTIIADEKRRHYQRAKKAYTLSRGRMVKNEQT
jgi:hypothetical protein